jgi:translocation and assembly module TamB
LKAAVDTAGQLLLSGRYQLDSGWYVLNYDFLRRRFRLLPGSNIDFNGPVAVAGLNITASYTAITSARDLLENEIPGLTPGLETALDQQLPFNVVLHMKGALGKPAIQFDIQLADSAAGLSNLLRIPILRKLAQLQQDASGVNRQVFSLLLLNRFVGEQSTDFFKGSGEGFSDVSSESVSKFLLSELDKIAADLFKGLDMEMNLNTFKDYTAGDAQQKAVSGIGVTKSFINNRLFITVGRSFGIEGQDANAKAARQKGVAFLPDVTSLLQLTADGKYYLRSYRKAQQEVVVDGYVTESGLGFILRIDYDSFQQLTRRRLVNRIGQ